VVFHAHPDDEALLSAGTIATAVAAGHRVVLVLATRGDAGDVGDSVLGDGEDLGARRVREARDSADALGVARLEFLPYADSGLTPQPDGTWPEGAFCAAPVDEAASLLIDIIRSENAEVLIADDRNGGYGHPDHVHVHSVAFAAALAAGIPLLQVTIDREFLSGGIELARSLGLDVPDGFVPPDVSKWYTPHAELTHEVAVGPQLAAKRASMAAHATQTTGAADTVRTLALFLGLPDDIFAIAFSTEWFVLASATGSTLPPPIDSLFTRPA
jgi:LmbE family N-acetylglucosaminyl deacetylase